MTGSLSGCECRRKTRQNPPNSAAKVPGHRVYCGNLHLEFQPCGASYLLPSASSYYHGPTVLGRTSKGTAQSINRPITPTCCREYPSSVIDVCHWHRKGRGSALSNYGVVAASFTIKHQRYLRLGIAERHNALPTRRPRSNQVNFHNRS